MNNFTENFCWLIFSLSFITATLLYYAFVIQPNQFAKRIARNGGTLASKEEIDQLFTDEDDPFSATEFAEFTHSETLRN